MMQALTQLINLLAETGVPLGAEAAEVQAAMGNAQRKSHGKGGGGKAEDREAQKQKDSPESRLKKGKSEKKSPKHSSEHEEEANGYLHSEQKSASPERELAGAHGAGWQPAGGGSPALPPAAAKLKSEGNELFKSGQFGEAVLKYSEAIEYVTGLGKCNTLCLTLGLVYR